MNRNEIFELYLRVMRKDREAEDTLIAEHTKKYPDNHLNKIKRGECEYYRQNLHSMYLHLYK